MMDAKTAVRALGALAQESRLAVFRALVRHGPAGLCAGAIATLLDLPASTLSFHLRDLCEAGLVAATRDGRTIRYTLRPDAWTDLLWFLGEECCQGRPALCASPAARITARLQPLPDAAHRPNVLFLCSHNAARSLMAESILRHLAGDRFDVRSAGLRPAAVHPLTLRVLQEQRLPTTGLYCKDLGELLGKLSFDHAFVVCERAQADCAQLPPLALEQQAWPFPDPAAAGTPVRRQLAAFRAVRDAIAARIAAWLDTPQPPRRKPTRRKTALNPGRTTA